MSIKFNENKENKDLIKLKEELLAELKIEQKKYVENLEEKMEKTNQLINESNQKFKENKDFFEKFLSQKFYLEKIEGLDKNFSKINDNLLAHEIRISKNIDDINSIRIKYDKIILDNLLLPGQIGPSCQFKNLSQYIKNNIYDMTKMKGENEKIINLSKEIKIKYDSEAKNITGLIDNSVSRSNQYTDNRINDFISILEHKTNEMSEKIMDIRMKFIQEQDKLKENINSLKKDFEEKLKKQDEKIKELNSIIISINDNLPDEENIHDNFDKLKSRIKNMKYLLLTFINNFQQLNINNNINSNSNNQSQIKNRRNSMMLGIDLSELINDNSEEHHSRHNKNVTTNENKLNDINMIKHKDRTHELLPPKRPRHASVFPSKNKSNQKQNIKLQLNNTSEISSDDNDNDNNYNKSRNKKDKKNKSKKKLEEINEKVNSNQNLLESKIYKDKNNKSSILNKSKGNNIKNSLKNKNNKNASRSIKKDSSFSNSINSFSNSSDDDYYNYYQEKDKAMDMKHKSTYHNKKINGKSVKQTQTINNQDKNLLPFSNSSQKGFNNLPHMNIESNNLVNFKMKNSYHNYSRNLNNTNTIINNQLSNSNMNSPLLNFYRTQQEEKNKIIKDFFSKYDRNAIHENLNLIKNRANLDLYNYSVSPPDNRHFLDTKKDEIYNPPLSKEFLLKNKISKNSKIRDLTRDKYNTINNKLNKGNSIEPNYKKIGMNNSSERKNYLNSTSNDNKFIQNKKVEKANKFTNTYRNYFPENVKKEKMYSMNLSKKF